MTITPSLPSTEADLAPSWPDDVVDLTDRRRLLLYAVFGVDVRRELVDPVFELPGGPAQSPAASSASASSGSASSGSTTGSTTMRSGGRSSSTVAR